ncbi:hypothetical protein NA727_19360, partial [Escherichia coli]|nr:hypothetical protein [Escherichia coli]
GGKNSLNRLIRCVCGKKSAQIREILISESAWEEMTCLFAPSLDKNSLTPARATNSGLESKKPTQSRFFYVLIQTSFQMNSQLKIHTYYLPLHLHIR